MSRTLALLVAPPARRLLDAFSRLTGARIGIYDHAFREVSVGRDRRGMCAFCSRLRRDPALDAACRAEDLRRRLAAAERGGLVAYRCHAGMDEAVMPLSEDGRLVGWVMVGQFRTRAAPPRALLAAAPARERAALMRAFAAAPLAARRGDVLSLFTALVSGIAAQRLVAPRRDPLLERLLAPGRTVTLAQAARAAGIGRTGMARRARAALGCGLRQAQVRARLERAATLLRGGAVRTVAEAARRAGFSDPAYFTRLWTRHRGTTPSHWLRRPQAAVDPRR